MVKLSVIICTYNRANSLADTLLCLTKQSYDIANWELIVVDNNSSDNTKEIIYEYHRKLPNLTYKFEPQQGLSFARNLGINSAKGAIIAFTDDDVLPENDWLTQIQNNMEKYNCDACGGYIAPKWESQPPAWLTEIFIEEHKGWIKIENLSDLDADLADRPNSGAVVTISLPLDA